MASVSLDLIDSHLDEQDVGDDAVVSLLRHELRRGSFHFVVAGPPSSTFAPPFRDPQHVYGILMSSARKHCLHPSQVERIRIANLVAERTAEACSIVHSWETGFLVLQPRSCLGSPSLFDLVPCVELARAGEARANTAQNGEVHSVEWLCLVHGEEVHEKVQRYFRHLLRN